LAVVARGNSSGSEPALRIVKLSGRLIRDPDCGKGCMLEELFLSARICAPDPLHTYPRTVRIDHYMTSRRGRWVARTTIDHAPWEVSLGESWHGKSCGPAEFDDPIPPSHYGVESLGNPCQTYAVKLTIQVGSLTASRRAVVRPRMAKDYCSP
jgi:hypothetical protein